MRQRLGYLMNLPPWLTVSNAFSLYSFTDTGLLLMSSCRSPFLGCNDCPLYPTHSPLYNPTWVLSSRASKKITEREFLAERVRERIQEIQELQAEIFRRTWRCGCWLLSRAEGGSDEGDVRYRLAETSYEATSPSLRLAKFPKRSTLAFDKSTAPIARPSQSFFPSLRFSLRDIRRNPEVL